MKKNPACTIFVLLTLLITCFSPGWPQPSATAGSKDGLWEGGVSRQTEAFIRVVDNRKEWENLWQRAFERSAPKIDFSRKVVACVFLGQDAQWLYSIAIGEPFRREDHWVVPYELAEMVLELAGPFKAGGQYAMKVLDRKKDAPMILEQNTLSGQQR